MKKTLCLFHQRTLFGGECDIDKVLRRHRPLRYMLHLHHATRLHYDFRIEVDGVLWSWAIPFVSSLVTGKPYEAIHVNDHSVRCYSTEDVILPGFRGAGPRLVWDQGTYSIENVLNRYMLVEAMKAGLEEGKLRFRVDGIKLQGSFSLTQTSRKNGKQWYFQKEWDEFAMDGNTPLDHRSVLTGRNLEEVRLADQSKVYWRLK
jgi:bifunctional non-homologous end joining protein LigD